MKNNIGSIRNESGSVVMTALVIIAAIFFLMAFSWAMGWVSVPFQVTSAQNVQDQWKFAYTFDESLQAAARQVCSTESAIKAADNTNEASQRRSQLLAIEQNYARIEGQYNARLRNAFEAKLVRPGDVPAQAPTLDEMRQRVWK